MRCGGLVSISHLVEGLVTSAGYPAVFALVNTIYLNAKWELPFDPSDTSSDDFTTGTGDHVSVKTMHNDTELDLVRGEGWRAVRLPYAGGKLSMWVLLPDRGGRGLDDGLLLGRGTGLGVAVTAWFLGFRHAFDADHISCIDNTTRKLMADGKRPLGTGFFFSFGHSTVIVAVGVGITVAARAVFGAIVNPGCDARTRTASYGK